MDKLFKFIFDIVIAIIIMFGAVLIYFGLKTEKVIGTMDSVITENFLAEMKKDSRLNYVEYEDYIHQLSKTGTAYDLQFEHKYNIWEPEYRMRTIEEIIAAQKAAYTGENIYHYREVVTNRPTVTDPIDNSGLTMNTETNESILSKATNTPSTGHVHTDACYDGHRHTAVYGTSDLSGVRVYAVGGFSKYFADDGAYMKYVDIFCADCRKPIYTMRYKYTYEGNRQGVAGYTIEYVYDTAGNTYPIKKPFNFTEDNPNYRYILYSIGDPWYSWIRNNQASGSSDDEYWSYSTPWIFGTYPTWDASGVRTDNAFTGCKNIYGHPNTACYPVGDRNKLVNVEYSRYYNGDLASMYNVKITCAECGSTILTADYNQGEDWSASYGSYGSAQVIQKSYKGTGGITSETLNVQTNGTLRVDNEGYLLYQYCRTLPNQSSNLSSNEWTSKYTATNVKWDYNNIPYLKCNDVAGQLDRVTYSTRYMPYAGCVSCSTYGENYSCGQSSVLACDKKVVSITPTHPVQSVYTNEALITTVIATCVDGSTRTVLASTAFSTAHTVTGQTVALTYADFTGKTFTCNIVVNVVPRNKVCANGHRYNLSHDGSDPGCPFCKNYIANIRMIHPTTSTLTITIGTSLQENGIKLLATYMDGHTEILTDGYIDNLDKQYLGTKMVTIGYKGAGMQILVTTVCAKMTCDICGFIYDLYPDGTNPGCPRCISKTPVFTGNVLKYDVEEYTEEILEKMYQEGSYDLTMDNTFVVWLKSKSSNIARNLLKKMYPTMSTQWLSRRYSENIKAK